MGHFKILISIIGILIFSFVPITFAQIKVGQRVPDFVTSTLDGKRFAMKEYLKQPENKVLILTFLPPGASLAGKTSNILKGSTVNMGIKGWECSVFLRGVYLKLRPPKNTWRSWV
jgi:hypothetical protein